MNMRIKQRQLIHPITYRLAMIVGHCRARRASKQS